MNEYFQHNKRSLIILAGLLFVLAIVLYFILLRPLLGEISSKEKAVVTKEEEIALLEEKLKIDHISEQKSIEELLLEKKIPLERKLDEYILSLYELELVTDSRIERIEFVYDSNLEQVEVEDHRENAEEPSPNEEDTEEQESDVTIDPIILEEKPEKLQVMTVKVTAASPDFDEFIKLLKLIEEQERISIVSKLDFYQPTEYDVYFNEDPLKTISFEAELSTFYYNE